jgi:hypothetical protein
MWWVVAAIVIVIVWFVWTVVGGTAGAGGNSGSPIQGCEGCDTLLDWWQSLSAAQKARMFAWYQTRKAHCFASCPK